MKNSTTLMLALAFCAGSVMTAKAEVIEETPLTQEMFKSWDGVGADAQPTGATPYWDAIELGTEGTQATVYGSGNVTNTDYADLTGYTSLVIEGSEGLALRVMINRQLDNSYIELNPTIGSDGKATVDLTGYEYVHLNAIKMGWGATGTVTALTLVKEEIEEPETPEDGTEKLTAALYHEWTGNLPGSEIKATSTYCEYNVGTEQAAGTTIYGNGNVNYLCYADLSEYTTLIIEGDAGLNVRLMFNRLEVGNGSDDPNGGSYVEVIQPIGEDGTYSYDLTSLEYAHLNAIKLPGSWAGGTDGTVTALKLSKGGTTGIETVEEAKNAEVLYDLQGRVVTTMGKGLFVKGGKVIMVK